MPRGVVAAKSSRGGPRLNVTAPDTREVRGCITKLLERSTDGLITEFSPKSPGFVVMVCANRRGNCSRIDCLKRISNHRQSRWYEEGPLKGPLGYSKFNSPWF